MSYSGKLLIPVIAALTMTLLLVNACSNPATPPPPSHPTPPASQAPAPFFTLSSAAFRDGEKIPAKYSCQGDNVSPSLSWSGAPIAAQSFAMITEDIDGPSGIITHWVIFNIPGTSRELAEAIPVQPQLSGGALQGNNIRGQPGYSGPCPPAGTTHRYEFTLFALDQSLNLKSGATRADLIPALQGHILAVAQLMGIYQRQ